MTKVAIRVETQAVLVLELMPITRHELMAQNYEEGVQYLCGAGLAREDTIANCFVATPLGRTVKAMCAAAKEMDPSGG